MKYVLIAFLIIVIAFAIAIISSLFSLRVFSKYISKIVEEAEKADKDRLFWEQWAKYFK